MGVRFNLWNDSRTKGARIADSTPCPASFTATSRVDAFATALDQVWSASTSNGSEAKSFKFSGAWSRIRSGEESTGFDASLSLTKTRLPTKSSSSRPSEFRQRLRCRARAEPGPMTRAIYRWTHKPPTLISTTGAWGYGSWLSPGRRQARRVDRVCRQTPTATSPHAAGWLASRIPSLPASPAPTASGFSSRTEPGCGFPRQARTRSRCCAGPPDI